MIKIGSFDQTFIDQTEEVERDSAQLRNAPFDQNCDLIWTLTICLQEKHDTFSGPSDISKIVLRPKMNLVRLP